MELTVITELLPDGIREAVETSASGMRVGEIRLRAGRPVSLSGGGENLRLPVCATSEQLSRLLTMFCDSSYHAHEQTLREGYVTYRGCRVGIGGVYSQTGLPSSVTSLCIRIQRHIRGAALPLVKTLAERDFSEGVIVYSPPGYGKTTLLRDLAAIISAPPILRNVAVVDSRRELEDEGLMRGCAVDIIAGTGKAAGIETATRTLSPQFIVCDEIGAGESAAILEAQNSGVPLAASAHAATLEQLFHRSGIKPLLDAGIFGVYCGIKRENGQNLLDIGRF